jgi:hypothetical protein
MRRRCLLVAGIVSALVAPSRAQQPQPAADPAKDFVPTQPVVVFKRSQANVGIIFGARIYGRSLVTGLDLFYYVPSSRDNYYREGDYRGTSRRIGGDGNYLGEVFCAAGYAAVGLQGAAGLGIDRLGLICGKIGTLSQGTDLPILGGRGGNPFKDTCNTTSSTGYLTGVRVRAGAWIDSIQGFCQAKE